MVVATTSAAAAAAAIAVQDRHIRTKLAKPLSRASSPVIVNVIVIIANDTNTKSTRAVAQWYKMMDLCATVG